MGPDLGGRGDQRRLRPSASAAADAGQDDSETADGVSPAGAARGPLRSRVAGHSPGRCSPTPRPMARACAHWPRCCSSATGSSRARPCWPRGCPAGSPPSTASWPTWRRWARPAAATSSKASAERSSRCRLRSSACGRCARTSQPVRWWWPPPIPPTHSGPHWHGHGARSDDSGRRPARVPGAFVVSLDAEPVLYVERGGKALLPLREPEDEWLRAGAGGAGRRGPPRAGAAARAGALRRRARRGQRGGRAADRAGLQAEPAAADAERLSLPRAPARTIEGCPRATRSTTRRGGSRPRSWEVGSTGSRPRTRASGATAGPSAWRAARCVPWTRTASTCSSASRAA